MIRVKTFSLTLLGILSLYTALQGSNIIACKTFAEIPTQIQKLNPTQQTLILVDIDDVLVKGKCGIGGYQWFRSNVERAMHTGASYEAAIDHFFKLFVKIQPYITYTPIERDTQKSLALIRETGATVLGVTSRPKETAQLSITQLDQLAFHFHAPHFREKNITFTEDEPQTYLSDIIFVGPGRSEDRGPRICSVLDKAEFIPDQIVAIDDVEHNLALLAAYFAELEIPFTGIHYNPKINNIPFAAKAADAELERILQLIAEEQK